ncbi:hypothetical protein PoB_001365300 [Plakobranchus ocellatus]|uniref:Uncharacterized protein n=1 Tax=Plakobranchus ocellatus TaxID=259542 RepID=A0AAV3YXN5_9GAST|nr:hypothetical protein PoB_001365300 [Plakobranchus ocellatus]
MNNDNPRLDKISSSTNTTTNNENLRLHATSNSTTTTTNNENLRLHATSNSTTSTTVLCFIVVEGKKSISSFGQGSLRIDKLLDPNGIEMH